MGIALLICLLAGPLLAQQKHYQEAHVYISGPSTPSALTSLAVENVRPMLLADRGFQTFEPLEQPDEQETFFRVWRQGQSLRYTSPPNATISFLFEPTESAK